MAEKTIYPAAGKNQAAHCADAPDLLAVRRGVRRAITISLIGLPVVILVQSGLLPLIYSKLIDQLNQTGGHIPHLETWVALFVGLHLVVFTGQRVNARFWSKLEHTTIKDMEQHIFGSLLAQSNQFHTGTHAGGLVAQAKRFTGGYNRQRLGRQDVWQRGCRRRSVRGLKP